MENNIEFVKKCEQFADDHEYGNISEELLKKCFEMPAEGVKVEFRGTPNTLFPAVFDNNFYIACERIGRYSAHNGVYAFVYRNGKTYVTRSYEVLKELRKEGYSVGCMYVPFANGENIVDAAYAEQWEKCK